jgi:DNA-binding SARP family transcriptional activator
MPSPVKATAVVDQPGGSVYGESSSDSAGTIGATLRAFRQTAGISQRKLADLVGLSVAAVRDLEQGRRRSPRPGSLARIDALLGNGVGRFRLSVLGPMEAWRPDGTRLRIGPPRQRAVLALLALEASRTVPRDTLIDRLWPAGAPSTAVQLLQAYVSRLRRVLAATDGECRRSAALTAHARGYRLDIDPNELDLTAFEQLVHEADGAAAVGQPDLACDRYAAALKLWRGRPLSDVELLRASGLATSLWGRRTGTTIRYADVAARHGRHDQVLPELWRLADDEPLHEAVHARLMVALGGMGEPASALQVYADVAARLDEALAVAPGPELVAARTQVLGPGTGRRAVVAAGTARVPRQLPPAPSYLSGRDEQLARLTRLLDDLGTGPSTPVAVVCGPVGVGSTALALHWASRVAAQFPDGQLHLALHGCDPHRPPLHLAEAIRTLLESLGVPDTALPSTVDGQVGLYRSLTAGRRLLVVLDDAADADQVRPLLPGTTTCLAIVTGRSRLVELATCHDAVLLRLGPLTSAESWAALTHWLGQPRLRAEVESVRRLIDWSDGLPKVLAAIANLVLDRPGITLANVAAELADPPTRLDVLDASGGNGLRAALTGSYDQLGPHQRLVLGLFARLPQAGATAAEVATAATIPPRETIAALRELVRLHIIVQLGDRFRLPSLWRCYLARPDGR